MTYNGKTYNPGQGNNSYIFPGVALGVICCCMRTIPDVMFLVAAQALAEMVSDEDLASGNLYPPLQDIQKCSLTIATEVMKCGYASGKKILSFIIFVFPI